MFIAQHTLLTEEQFFSSLNFYNFDFKNLSELTDKQEKILSTALELFANEGYDATSTSKISIKAGVSEGLIFRHFKNKKGLLEAIMQECELRLHEGLQHILTEKDPLKIISETIESPFQIDQKDYDYWKLQYKIKWVQEFNNPQKMQPLLDKLCEAFEALNFKDPKNEAVFLTQVLDTIFIELLRGNIDDTENYKSFLLQKYKI